MKTHNFYNFLLVSLLSISLISLSSCDKNPNGNTDIDKIYSEILESYVDNTVIATYSNLASRAMELNDLCNILKENPSNDKVQNCCDAWKASREFWEKSEAFLYGPAEYYNLDPHIDSWPLDKNQLDQVLAGPNIMNIDGAYVRSNFGASLIGFHAIEYVLFRDGQARSISDISAAELVYLCAVAQVLAEDCILLEGNWAGQNNLSAEKQEMLDNAELSISSNFGYEMKNAGNPGSRYTSQFQAIEAIIKGCEAIADEVGNSKIADPVFSDRPLEERVLMVESWYSWNSISDFVNNINSIQNSYFGSINGLQSHSLSNYISSKNPALDNEIKANIENAKAKIIAIGEPFRNHLDNKVGAEEAINACDALSNSFQRLDANLE